MTARWLIGVFACMAIGPLAVSGAAEPEPVVVYREGEGDYASYRIPALVATPAGTLLAFCEGRVGGRGDAGNIDLLMRRSTDGGGTWGPVHVVVDDGGRTCGNPVPVVDRTTGRIVLVLTKNEGDANEGRILRGEAPPRTVWVTHSDDDGQSWAPPREISDAVRQPDFRWYATGPGHGIQLDSGRIVVSANHSKGPDHGEWFSHVIYSDDGGAAWHLGGITGPRCNESTVAELSDGRLYLNMRSYHGINRRHVAYSRDGGETWSPPEPDDALIEPVCQASVLRLSGAPDRLLFSNPASTSRERLTVRMSADGGTSWPWARVLHEGPAAYSDLAQLDTETAACLYEAGDESPYETIRFARFPLASLQQPTSE